MVYESEEIGHRTKLSAERNFIPSLLVQQSPYVQAVGRRPQVATSWSYGVCTAQDR
jgi:hypothetical protein